MKNQLILSIKKQTDTLIEQTKTKSRETLEIEMNEQFVTFSFNPPLKLVEEGKWLLGVTSFETNNSFFNITDKNNSFSITIPGHWNFEDSGELITKLEKLLELRSAEDIELYEKNFKKMNSHKKGDR